MAGPPEPQDSGTECGSPSRPAPPPQRGCFALWEGLRGARFFSGTEPGRLPQPLLPPAHTWHPHSWARARPPGQGGGKGHAEGPPRRHGPRPPSSLDAALSGLLAHLRLGSSWTPVQERTGSPGVCCSLSLPITHWRRHLWPPGDGASLGALGDGRLPTCPTGTRPDVSETGLGPSSSPALLQQDTGRRPRCSSPSPGQGCLDSPPEGAGPLALHLLPQCPWPELGPLLGGLPQTLGCWLSPSSLCMLVRTPRTLWRLRHPGRAWLFILQTANRALLPGALPSSSPACLAGPVPRVTPDQGGCLGACVMLMAVGIRPPATLPLPSRSHKRTVSRRGMASGPPGPRPSTSGAGERTCLACLVSGSPGVQLLTGCASSLPARGSRASRGAAGPAAEARRAARVCGAGSGRTRNGPGSVGSQRPAGRGDAPWFTYKLKQKQPTPSTLF